MLVFVFSNITAQTEEKVYEALLKTHVSSNGKVDYKGLQKNKELLEIYLDYLHKKLPQKNWSSNRAKAYWLNAYNAYTLKLVVDNYPISSLNDVKKENKKAWEISFAKVGGHTYTLDYIEHKILRRWHDDARIHVGINSASVSGPRFPNFLFTAENVDKKLDYLMKSFLNDGSKNKITPNAIEVSKIFEWYKEDFSTNGNLIAYINRYLPYKVNNNATVKTLEYNWNLNEFKKK